MIDGVIWKLMTAKLSYKKVILVRCLMLHPKGQYVDDLKKVDCNDCSYVNQNEFDEFCVSIMIPAILSGAFQDLLLLHQVLILFQVLLLLQPFLEENRR